MPTSRINPPAAALADAAALLLRWGRARWRGLAVVYGAHALPYFWVMENLGRFVHPVGVWVNVLLNALLAPSLLLLVIYTFDGSLAGGGGVVRRSLLALYIVAHHLLLMAIFLVFMLHYLYFETIPNFFLVHEIGNLPFIFEQLIFELMGYEAWLTIILLSASCIAALRWTRRAARPFPPARAGVLFALLCTAFAVKDAAIHLSEEIRPIGGPPLRTQFRVYGFIPQLARQFAEYLTHRQLEALPWPGKISDVAGAAAGMSAAAAADASAAPHELKNIIIIQIETFDKWVLDEQVEGRYVMPNAQAVKSQTRFFDNFFAMHAGGRTADAEFSAITGLLPQAFLGFRSANLAIAPSLAKVLSWHGYHSVAMHANREHFFDRTVAYRALGFDQFLGQPAYTGEGAGSRAKDLEFFRQSWPRIEALPEPFLAYLITIQAHSPYRNYADDTYADVPGLSGGRGHYIKSMHEVDQAIGFLWGRLRDSGLLQRSIVLLYGDHPSYSFPPPDCIHRECIPFMLHAPGVAPGVDAALGSHLDITPTILDLLGIEEAAETYLGASLLGDDDARKVLFHDGASIRQGADGLLSLENDPADHRYIEYSDSVFGGLR